ncbi:MAG TPA: heme exporter protein CcmB [Acidimicrobiales bacterium]|nr:heme exporter protein CcmB [Acidimicrobiales bacterium]
MWRDAVLVCGKDLRIEARTRVLLWQVVPFGVLALILFALALGPSEVALRHGAPGLLWLALLLASVLASSRSAAIEATEGTRATVRLLGLDAGGVFLGKAIALGVQLLVLAGVLELGLLVLFHVDGGRLALTTPICLLAVAALAAVGTLYGALVAGTEVSVTLLPLLVLPALAPVLIAGERGTASVLAGGGPGRWAIVLAVMAVVYLAVGVVLYGPLEDPA